LPRPKSRYTFVLQSRRSQCCDPDFWGQFKHPLTVDSQ
jgi:hypothetical protein